MLDTSAVVAALDAGDSNHARIRAWMEANDEQLITTPLCVAEMDYLVRANGGEAAAASLWDEIEAGAYVVEWWPDAMKETIEVAASLRSHDIGLADASLVVLARHLATILIASFDERHFRQIAPLTGEPAFTLLPADA